MEQTHVDLLLHPPSLIPSSLSPTHQCWTLRIIARSDMSSMCRMRRRCVLCAGVGSYVSSLGIHLVVGVLHIVTYLPRLISNGGC